MSSSRDWISVNDGAPADRRAVHVWGVSLIPPRRHPFYLGTSKYNIRRDGFDIERAGMFTAVKVTHWAEIVGPTPTKSDSQE